MTARSASAAYLLRKYVRRNRIAVGVAAGLVLLLAGFAAVQAVQVRRVTRERDRANRITDFMLQIFKVSDPSESRGNSITARELLDKASKDIDSGMTKDPEVQAQMLHVMADVYDSLGLHPRAEALSSRAAEIRRRVLGPNHPDTLDSLSLLSWQLYHAGRYADAEKLERDTLDAELRVLGPNDPRTIHSMNHLAGILGNQGRLAEAEKFHRQAREAARRALGPDSRDFLVASANLAHDLNSEDRYAEAEAVMRDGVATSRRALGKDNPDASELISVLGWTLDEEKKYVEAEKVQREALDIQRRVLGPEHLLTLLSMTRLGLVLQHQRKFAEAEDVFRGNLEVQRRVLGPENPETALTIYNLSCLNVQEGHRDEALKLLRQAVDHGLFPDEDLGISTDDDFAPLRGDPRFTALIAHAKEVAHAKTSGSQRAN